MDGEVKESKKPKPKTVELVRSDYQPTKREKEETFSTDASFEQAVDALLQPVKPRWIDKLDRQAPEAAEVNAKL